MKIYAICRVPLLSKLTNETVDVPMVCGNGGITAIVALELELKIGVALSPP